MEQIAPDALKARSKARNCVSCMFAGQPETPRSQDKIEVVWRNDVLFLRLLTGGDGEIIASLGLGAAEHLGALLTEGVRQARIAADRDCT